jgi:hypothetical protein
MKHFSKEVILGNTNVALATLAPRIFESVGASVSENDGGERQRVSFGFDWGLSWVSGASFMESLYLIRQVFKKNDVFTG